jgi:hypothetical protein
VWGFDDCLPAMCCGIGTHKQTTKHANMQRKAMWEEGGGGEQTRQPGKKIHASPLSSWVFEVTSPTMRETKATMEVPLGAENGSAARLQPLQVILFREEGCVSEGRWSKLIHAEIHAFLPT